MTTNEPALPPTGVRMFHRVARNMWMWMPNAAAPTMAFDDASDSGRTSLSAQRRTDGNLKASLKRTFKQVKAASQSLQPRSRSLSPSSSLQKRKAHSRTQSDVRGRVVHAHTAPHSLAIGLVASLPSITYGLDSSSQYTLTQPPSERDISHISSKMDIAVPRLLQQGTPMTKVSAKRQRKAVFQLDPDQGQIIWQSGSSRKQKISTFYARYLTCNFRSSDHLL
jgi:hypothetical protein